MTALARVLERLPGAEPFRMGDGPELCAEWTALILSGAKTATCSALRDFGEGGAARPLVGRRDVACHWDWTPACVIETVEVTERRFCDVPEGFALAEGEGRFADWRVGHIAYFQRNGGWAENMWLICERFRLVEVLG